MGVTDEVIDWEPEPAPGPAGPDAAPVEWDQLNRAQLRDAAAPYVRRRKVYVLDFDDHSELSGLTVRARSVSLGGFLKLVKMSAALDANVANLSKEDVEVMEEMFQRFAKSLVSWNLQAPPDDDPDGDPVPVPCTFEGVMGQDAPDMLLVVQAWLSAIGDVGGPLDGTSNGGGPALAGSIPMATPSESPPN